VSGQLHSAAALSPGKELRHLLDRRLAGPQSRSGRCGKEIQLTLPGIEIGPSSPEPVAILTELSPTQQDALSSLFIMQVRKKVSQLLLEDNT
jgi:hypothetical protein